MMALLLAGALALGSSWTATDTGVEAAFGVALAADLSTSVDQDPRIYEKNPILGRHPSKADYLAYDGTCLLLHAGVARLLPPPYRRIWQGVWIASEAASTTRNLTLGAQFRF
jgi:hypothetical protein